MFWGNTPALNLHNEVLKQCRDDVDELNLLIIGGCDARHLLTTLSQAYKHKHCYVNLFVVDGCPELVARQLLLTTLALEKTVHFGLLEKTRRFLEIYGNLILRRPTSRYLIAKSRQLINMITNPELMKNLVPSISIENMKYSEKDYMEELIGFWTSGNMNQFNVCDLWNIRLRSTLGVRYDTKNAVFDWDYHMRMKEVAGQICWTEYKHFREHGVAFTWLETEVCRPNTSLVAGVYKSGDKYLHRGYLGDISSSPLVSYGLDCIDKDMLKASNGVNFKRATDISERNVMRMFYELEHRKEFDVSAFNLDTENNLGMVVLSNIDARISEYETEAPLKLREDSDTYIEVDYGKIHFLSLSSLDQFPHKPQFQALFNAVFVGHNMLGRLKPSVWTMARDGALIIMETRKYLVDWKRDDLKSFGDQIKQVAATAQGEPVHDFDPQKDDFARFVIKRAI